MLLAAAALLLGGAALVSREAPGRGPPLVAWFPVGRVTSGAGGDAWVSLDAGEVRLTPNGAGDPARWTCAAGDRLYGWRLYRWTPPPTWLERMRAKLGGTAIEPLPDQAAYTCTEIVRTDAWGREWRAAVCDDERAVAPPDPRLAGRWEIEGPEASPAAVTVDERGLGDARPYAVQWGAAGDLVLLTTSRPEKITRRIRRQVGMVDARRSSIVGVNVDAPTRWFRARRVEEGR